MNFRDILKERPCAVGTFVKTPSPDLIEIFALAPLDFVCFDAEHSAFGRRELDWSLALARALKLPAWVRVSHASAPAILQALDGGAAGVVVPHVDSLATAEEVARWARFGAGGRGYSGTTRSGGFGTRGMDNILKADAEGAFVVAQIEDPSAMEDIEAIAALPGIDALFFGAADMAVGLGLPGQAEIDRLFGRVVAAAAANRKPVAAHCADAGGVTKLVASGASIAFVGSDQGLVLSGARGIAGAAAKLNSQG